MEYLPLLETGRNSVLPKVKFLSDSNKAAFLQKHHTADWKGKKHDGLKPTFAKLGAEILLRGKLLYFGVIFKKIIIQKCYLHGNKRLQERPGPTTLSRKLLTILSSGI